MTGAETLRMFARLRGVPEAEIPLCVGNLGKILHFAQYMDKPCGTYRYGCHGSEASGPGPFCAEALLSFS